MKERTEKYLPVDECVPGHLYWVSARNIIVGVFNGSEKYQGFIGLRWGMSDDDVYLDTELHWDTGGSCGTARPLLDLGPIPEGIELGDNEELFKFMRAYKYSEDLLARMKERRENRVW
jgi:hypothetical protein